MALTNEPPPFALTGLTARLQRVATRVTGFRAPAGDLRLIGPFRAFRADAKLFAAGNTEDSLHETGWRGLMIDADGAVALAEISAPAEDGGDQPRFSLRGSEAAVAFQAALETAGDAAAGRGGDYAVRFLAFPSLFLTAVWLIGADSLFVPTRIDAKGRPEAKVYEKGDFTALVQHRFQSMARAVTAPPQGTNRATADAGPAEASNAQGPQ